MTSDPSISTSTTERRRWVLGIVLVALALHLGIGVGGVWTFEPLNYDDPQVLALAADRSVAEILTEPTWYAYKPVYFLSVKIDTIFGGGTSGFAHVHGAALHALAAALLFLVLAGLVRNRWIAGAVALVFAAHPVHVESVAWISGRKDVLSLVFVLAAHLVYRRARQERKASIAAPLLLVLGGLTKGTVWVWSGVLLLDELVEALRLRARGEKVSAGEVARRWVPCLLVSVAGIALDGWMAVRHGPGAVDHGVSTVALAAASAGVYARYVFHLLVPAGLSIDYAVDPAGTWASPLAWLGLLLLVGAVALFVLSWRRRWPLGLLASGLWLLGLLPVNNLWPRTAILMADRYLYLPAIGLYLLLFGLLARSRAARTGVLALVVVVFGVLGVVRTGVFADSRRVWADATAKEPESALAWFQRANDAAVRGAWNDAATWAEKAIALEPRPEILVKARLLKTGALLAGLGIRQERGQPVEDADLQAVLDEANRASTLAQALETMPLVREDPREVRAEAEVLRGKALEHWRDPASAMAAYEKAVLLWPEHATAHYDLATLLAATGSTEDLALAESHLARAILHRSTFLDARIQLATVIALQGRLDEALTVLDHAEARHGRTPELLFAQAQVHLAGRQDVQKAEALLRELNAVAPDHPKATRLLSDIQLAQGRVLLDQGRTERDRGKMRNALQRFDAALRVRARCWEAEVGAGDALFQLGRYREARARYRKALDVAPQQAWIERLHARTAVLESARLARYAEDDVDRVDAARQMADAVRLPVTALDLGFLALHEELAWLEAVADRLGTDGPASQHAGSVLRAFARAATGDEVGALDALRSVLTATGPEKPDAATLDAALLLRAHLRDRAADVEGARSDYRFLADRRPDDAMPRLWLLRLDLREARARLSIARGFSDRPEGIAAATAELDRAAEAIRVFADKHPDVLTAGLVATEADMHRGRWIPALRRLNDLKTRFPREPGIHRGQSAIYVSQYLGGRREPTLLEESARALRRALTLDPRSARTLLDASQVARVAGDLRRAIDHARRARLVELVDDGPAARVLSDLHVAIGRDALKRGDGPAALKSVAAARLAAPGSASPWVLLGDLYLAARDKLDDAYEAHSTAMELEPLSPEARRGLARTLHQRIRVLSMKAGQVRIPPPPFEADPDGWKAMTPEERGEALAAWEGRAGRLREQREYLDRLRLREVETALRLDPDHDGNDNLETLRLELTKGDAREREHQAYQEAHASFAEGTRLYTDGQVVQALGLFRQATATSRKHLHAHLYTALALYALLKVPGEGTDEAAELEARYWHEAFEALREADALDADEEFPERHRVRGLLNELRWRREKQEAARVAALRAWERFVRAMEAPGAGDEELLRDARRRLKKLGGE